ncbi:succinate dehydrogenase cytochrome b subunit [Flammeovirgaceae bacterium SG7u.111]|nr:succinate dehydrogenase cytochrome b subunit [Flammeovirgaceae bacterium SG7u.132]WPO38677.1 succinate dehydrogenase cytochrome b subunit [Flammeovirgaceae bacterium SG7u.111]
MSWVKQTLSSTLGRKVLMSLTGIFLVTFLIVHASGNMQLLKDDGGQAFNMYTKFMTTNPLIKAVSFILYGSIILHVIDSIMLTMKNRSARPIGYKYTKSAGNSSWASRNMGLLGAIILVFLVIHLKSFWFEMKFGSVPMVDYEGESYKNLYVLVIEAFKSPIYTAFYALSMIFLGFHLQHGIASAFQTLGMNHKKYTPLIKSVGLVIAIIIPLLFAIQPIYVLLLA